MVTVHLEVQALPWEGEDNGKVSRGSHKAQESFLVPLGERCSSEKGKGKSAQVRRGSQPSNTCRTLRQRRAAKPGGLRARGVSDSTEARLCDHRTFAPVGVPPCNRKCPLTGEVGR